jgi:transmembrane sensor
MGSSSEDTSDIDSAVLLRYLSGQCDDREAASVRKWLLAKPVNAANFDALSRAWTLAGEPPRMPDTKAIWERLAPKLVEPQLSTRRPQSRFDNFSGSRPRIDGLRHEHTSNFAWARAAVILIALAIGPLAWWMIGNSMRRDTDPIREYRTANGQRAIVHLLDGSRITMGPGTLIRIPKEFDKGSRLITLEGEALFDVTHDSAQPFIVRLRNAETQDLGTKFVISAYPDDSLSWVAVVDGRVAVRSRARQSERANAVLVKGEATTILPGGHLRTEHDVALASYTSWTTGRLVFDNARLGDAIPQLSRWYDTDFRLADTRLADRRLFATLQDEPLSEVLKLLALSLDLRIERRGDVVVISSKPASNVAH